MLLACTPWGPPPERGKTLLFLHGSGGTGSLWRPIAALLEDGFACLAVDQRGHGASRLAAAPRASDYGPLQYASDVVETLRSRRTPPVWVVGHSMGARTASALAHLAPSSVRGLCLVDLGFEGKDGANLGRRLSDFLRALPAEFPSRREARDHLLAGSPDDSIARYLLAVSRTNPDGRTTFPFDRDALLATVEAARESTIAPWIEEAGRAGIPVLALRGAKSQVWTREQFERDQARMRGVPRVRLEEVPGAGHGLPFETREAFADRLRRWIAEEG